MNRQPIQEPLIFDELLARCMGETEFAQRIVKDFLESSRPLLDDIGNDIQHDSVQDAARTVHRLKGTAATVAARPFFESLLELENLLRTDEPQGISELTEKLAFSCQRFEEVRRFAETRLFR